MSLKEDFEFICNEFVRRGQVMIFYEEKSKTDLKNKEFWIDSFNKVKEEFDKDKVGFYFFRTALTYRLFFGIEQTMKIMEEREKTYKKRIWGISNGI